MMIMEIGQLMADTYAQLRGAKPLIKRYLKHPPKNEEKVKTLEFFLSWLQEWEKEAIDILTVEKKVKERPPTN